MPYAAYEAGMIDAAQIRAARGLLDWKLTDLAEQSGVSLASLKNIEGGKGNPRASTLLAIRQAFERAGVQIVEMGDIRPGGRGVRWA